MECTCTRDAVTLMSHIMTAKTSAVVVLHFSTTTLGSSLTIATRVIGTSSDCAAYHETQGPLAAASAERRPTFPGRWQVESSVVLSGKKEEHIIAFIAFSRPSFRSILIVQLNFVYSRLLSLNCVR